MRHSDDLLEHATKMREEFIVSGGAQSRQVTSKLDAVWDALPLVTPDPDHLAANRIITWNQTSPISSAYDLIRTRVLHQMRQNGWRSVAITAPTVGCGKTLTSINLAFSIARRRGLRSLLVDLDLRRPQVASYIGLPGRGSFAAYLRDEATAEGTFVRCAPNFAVATNAPSGEEPIDHLLHASTPKGMDMLVRRLGLDIVIFDLPPMLANDDALSFAPNVDGVVLVLEAGVTTAEEASFCEMELAQVTNVVGVVLNKCRFAPEIKNYY